MSYRAFSQGRHNISVLLGMARGFGSRNIAGFARMTAVAGSVANTRLAATAPGAAFSSSTKSLVIGPNGRFMGPVTVEARSELSTAAEDILVAGSSASSAFDHDELPGTDEEEEARARLVWTSNHDPPSRSVEDYRAKYEALFEQSLKPVEPSPVAEALSKLTLADAANAAIAAGGLRVEADRREMMAEYVRAKKAASQRLAPHHTVFRDVVDERDNDTDFLRGEKARAKTRKDALSRSEADDLHRAAMLSGLGAETTQAPVALNELKKRLADPAAEAKLDLVREVTALGYASASEIRRAKIAAIVDHYKRREGDTGSSEVQIAIMTEKLHLFDMHRARNKQDKQSNLAYARLQSRRRRLLAYLKRHRFRTYQILIRDLDIDEQALMNVGRTTNTLPYLRAEPVVSKRKVPLAIRPVDAYRAKIKAERDAQAAAAREAELDRFDQLIAEGGFSAINAVASKGKKA